MPLETKQILITVKTYPNPSRKYEETVCVAGIDLGTRKWIRLYPIPFRDLDDYQKFKKYSVIEIKAEKARDDTRPESYRVDSGSINVLEFVDAQKSTWQRRKEILLPTISKSFCDIIRESADDGKSLGMFKPQNVQFLWQKAKPQDEKERDQYYAQLKLYSKSKKAIETIPYDFRYSFFCHGISDCPGHNLPIIDWEIYQSYRSWKWKYKDEATLLEKIKQRWYDGMCLDKHDTYFFVGNMKRFRDNFMVLGVFYPLRVIP